MRDPLPVRESCPSLGKEKREKRSSHSGHSQGGGGRRDFLKKKKGSVHRRKESQSARGSTATGGRKGASFLFGEKRREKPLLRATRHSGEKKNGFHPSGRIMRKKRTQKRGGAHNPHAEEPGELSPFSSLKGGEKGENFPFDPGGEGSGAAQFSRGKTLSILHRKGGGEKKNLTCPLKEYRRVRRDPPKGKAREGRGEPFYSTVGGKR